MTIMFFGPIVTALQKKKRYCYFMQDGATAQVLGDRPISLETLQPADCSLQPAMSPDLNICDFYLWRNLKSKVYSDKPHILDKFNICETIKSTDISKLKPVSIFSRDLTFV
jgi:hypothetical protein